MSDLQRPITQRGNTVRIVSDPVTAPAGVQIPRFSSPLPAEAGTDVQNRIRVGSLVSGEVAIGWGDTAAQAVTNSVFPVGAGTSQKCITMASGQCEVFTFPPNQFFSALSNAGAIPVDIFPGAGA